MYAIVFDFDTEIFGRLYPNNSRRNAYTDIRPYLTTRGFEWKQGSTYFGNDTIDAVRCVTIVQAHVPARWTPVRRKNMRSFKTTDAFSDPFGSEKALELARRYPWFKPAIRDIRMLRIEENNDLTIALDDDEDV